MSLPPGTTPDAAGLRTQTVESPLCWHCQARPADPASTRPLQLRRYTGPQVERTQVLVPACRPCAQASQIPKFLWAFLLLAWVALTVVGIIMIAASPDNESVRIVWALLITLWPFVVVLPVGLVVPLRLAKRAGIRNPSRVTYPPVQKLRAAGWTTVRLTMGAYRAGKAAQAGLARLDDLAEEGRRSMVVKSCSACRRPVSPTAQAGQRCPHCGVLWTTEHWEGGAPMP